MITYVGQYLLRAGNAACRSCAYEAVCCCGRINIEGIVESGHAVNLAHRDSEGRGDILHHLPRDESKCLLCCSENLYKAVFLVVKPRHHLVNDGDPGITASMCFRVLLDLYTHDPILSHTQVHQCAGDVW